MKISKILFLSAAFLGGVTATYSQVNPPDQVAGSDSLQTDSATRHYQTFPAPNFGRHYIGALGSYTTRPETSATEQHLTISGDEENPGKIWIEGLTSARIFALRKKEAGTYKIPAQKAGTQSVREGTLIYDENTREINICLGCSFNDDNPADAFSHTDKKSAKTPVIHFNGIKAEPEASAGF